jgi:hypothetical protein
MIKKIILWFILFFSFILNTFALNDTFYYWNNSYKTDYSAQNTNILDSNNNIIDTYNTYYSTYLGYDDWYWLYYISNMGTWYSVYINENWTYWARVEYACDLYNWACVWTDSYLTWLWYYRFWPWYNNTDSIWNKPLYYDWSNNLYISNNTNWADSINFWKHPYQLELFNINDTHIAIADELTNWNYQYYIYEWLWSLKYSSPEITFTGWPSSCNDFSYDQMFYDECNMFGFTEFCNMDMYWVCGWKPELKYNWENKIILETPFDSFSEENTYLTSLNTSPNENIEWFFTDQYVWNSDLQCRVYFKTDEIVPSCSWRLIQDWNNLYCNPNLTHFWVTYSSTFFPYYINETTNDYLCWSIYISSWTEWPPWPPWIDWIDWINWVDWLDW